MPGALACLLSLVAAAVAEPGLRETQEAAARAAGGTAAEDASRMARARLAHWAPQLRGQGLVRDDEKSRAGEYRLAPLREQDLGTGHVWSVMLAWDFAQVIYARDESQLALAHAHLARLRREAADRAAQLWVQRPAARAAWRSATAGARVEACLALLRITAELDALTAGLFHDVVAREEAACAAEEGPPPPGPEHSPELPGEEKK